MKKKTLALIAAAVLTATMSFARPRKAAEITMSGYEGSSTLENFPVLVRISPERIDGFSYADCAEGGVDISFVAADGTTLLAHEVDTWDTTGESLVWVRVPSVSGTDTTFTFRWNDAAPPSVTSSDVWSAGYAGVWHLNEAGNGAQSVADATANALSGTGNNNSAAATGKIGGARGIRKEAKNGPAVTVPASGTAIDDLPPSFTVSGCSAPVRVLQTGPTSSRARMPTAINRGVRSSAETTTAAILRESRSIPTATAIKTIRSSIQRTSSRRTHGRNTPSSTTMQPCRCT